MSLTADDARRLALALPDAIEADHHGRPSFRVAGKIFATLWDPEHLNVMLGPEQIRAAVERAPDVCSEVWWGKKLSAVRVELAAISPRELEAMLAEAWSLRAPKRLLGEG